MKKEIVMYVYATNVGGANGQYVYVQPVTGGIVNSSGQQVFKA